MFKKIMRFFNIREEEQGRAIMLFAYQFLSVATMVLGRIIRDTLFIKRYDINQLPLMYIGIAAIVSGLTFVYTKRSIFYRLDRLIISVFSISALMTLLFVFLIKQQFAPAFPLLYIFVEVAGAFMMFQFWSFANEMLDSREAKRVLGFVGGGGVLASLLAGVGVSEIVKYMPVENTLMLNVVFLGICIIIVRRMGIRYKAKLQRGVVVKTGGQIAKVAKTSVFSFIYVKYIAIITSFIFVVVTFIDYQFKIAASQHFNEQELAAFFGAIYAIFGGAFSFFFQFFAISRLLKISVFLSLAILPAMITGFSSLYFIFLLAPSSIVFITMARASDYAFRYTINDAAMQLLYIPLNPKLKSRAKAMIDGIVKPLSIGFSGLIIYFLASNNIEQRVISSIVVTVGILWLIVIFIIRREYVTVLIDNIRKKKLGNEDLSVKQQLIESIVVDAVNSDNEEEIFMALDMIEKGRYFNMGRYFIPLLSHPSPGIKTKILKLLRMMESRFYTYDILRLMQDKNETVIKEAILTYGYMQMEKSIKYTSTFLNHESLQVTSAAVISLIKYGGISGVMLAAPLLKEMIESKQAEDRTMAAYILGEIGQQNMQHQLFHLLNDSSPHVRREAVKASRKIGAAVVIPKLFFMLLDKNAALDASRALSSFGERILVPAQNILENSLDSYQLKSEVAKMLGEIRSTKAIMLLLDSLNNKSDELRNAILLSLKRIINKTEYSALDNSILEKYLFKEFYIYFQMLYYKHHISKEVKLPHLNNVLESKLKSCFARVFSILSLIYGTKLFDTIYFNISQRFVGKDQKSNAIEIIDNIADKDVRKLLIPLIETSDKEKLLKLGFQSFKIKTLKFHEILEVFLTDDSEWVRSVTLYLIAKEKIIAMSNRVPMFMYDPSPLVRETALFAAFELKLRINDDDLIFLLNDSHKNVVGYANYVVSILKNN